MAEQPQTDRPRIFISHSWQDKQAARLLEEELDNAGVKVWIDHSGVRGGDNLPKRISKALGWCDILLLLWSDAASKSHWVELEWTNAISLKKKIIPCLLDSTNLPEILANTLYLDFHDIESGLSELLTTLNLGQHSAENVQYKSLSKRSSLRSQRLENFSDEALKQMLREKDFYDRAYNPSGKGVRHQYEVADDVGTKIVIDYATNLIWQQCPTSIKPIEFKELGKHLKMFNIDHHRGHEEWRLPTLEEAMSLMEPGKHNKLYLNSVFRLTEQQGSIWTADKFSNNTIWVVHFLVGEAIKTQVSEDIEVHDDMNHALVLRVII